MGANLASDRKFRRDFGALRAPANFESNLAKSLPGPSGEGGGGGGGGGGDSGGDGGGGDGGS